MSFSCRSGKTYYKSEMALSIRYHLAVLFVAAVLVRLLFHYLTGFTADDALITFRYAENLVAGHGLVYNPGEKVLGTTTPLFTFILSIFLIFKMTPFNAALLVSLISSGLTAVVIYRFAQHLRFTTFSFVPALVYILWPRSVVADSSGMETAFFSLLIISAWFYQHRQLRFYSVGVATLAAVTRPEGFFILGILLVYNSIKERHNLWAYWTIPLMIIVPWLVFSYFYFGTIVPNSITGKIALYTHMSTNSIWEKLVYLLGLHNSMGWIMLSAAICGGWWLYQKQNFGKLEIIWLIVMLLFFTTSRTALFFWYVVPIYPVYLLFASAALPFLGDKFGELSKRYAVVRVAFALFLSFGLFIMGYHQLEYYKDYSKYLNDVHKSIGLYLRDNAKPTDVVAARYIGHTGYYSNLEVLDRDGIVTPEAAEYNREGNYLGLIIDYRPDWVVAAPTREGDEFAQSGEFLDKYHLVKSFGWDERVTHNLYQRTN